MFHLNSRRMCHLPHKLKYHCYPTNLHLKSYVTVLLLLQIYRSLVVNVTRPMFFLNKNLIIVHLFVSYRISTWPNGVYIFFIYLQTKKISISHDIYSLTLSQFRITYTFLGCCYSRILIPRNNHTILISLSIAYSVFFLTFRNVRTLHCHQFRPSMNLLSAAPLVIFNFFMS